jgi:hypothetical protein
VTTFEKWADVVSLFIRSGAELDVPCKGILKSQTGRKLVLDRLLLPPELRGLISEEEVKIVKARAGKLRKLIDDTPPKAPEERKETVSSQQSKSVRHLLILASNAGTQPR